MSMKKIEELVEQAASGTQRHGIFVLQFPVFDIPGLADRYGYQEDDEALEAGRKIRNGDYGRENLMVIVRWKSRRSAHWLDDNSEIDISRALRFACDPRTSEKSAIEALDRLVGVGIPMASAILTAAFPEKYTVIDWRALESLGNDDTQAQKIDYYLQYLAACRDFAVRFKVPLRTLDRALWQWSKEQGKEDRCSC